MYKFGINLRFVYIKIIRWLYYRVFVKHCPTRRLTSFSGDKVLYKSAKIRRIVEYWIISTCTVHVYCSSMVATLALLSSDCRALIEYPDFRKKQPLNRVIFSEHPVS